MSAAGQAAPTVAIVHYHLRPGGVSSVIRRVSAALANAGIRHAILSGEPCGDREMPVHVVDGLGYGGLPDDPASGVERLKAAAAAALGGEPDVWHFHNPTLGKNPRIAGWIDRLIREGAAMVLQLHDLAEDDRPANFEMVKYFPYLYPVAPRIEYVFLNSSDRDLFLAAGLPEAHLVPNPLPDAAPAPPPPAGPPLVLYPVRGIPRKNLGELLLLAALAPPGTRFALARAPENPRWLAEHEFWKSTGRRLGLPVEFEVADRLAPEGGCDSTLGSWVAAATHFATTSIAEGFGMTFIEAAAAGRPLIGRDIPRVTRDFAASGMGIGRLYDGLLVGGREFCLLPRNEQAAWIERARCRPAAVEVVADGARVCASGWLEIALAAREPTVRPQQLATFSAASVTAKLIDIYRGLAAAPCQPPKHLAPAMIEVLARKRIARERTALTARSAAS